MSKRLLYYSLLILIPLGVYGYEFFLVKKEQFEIVSKGKMIKPETNEFFLPTSTTNQVVHHNGYSLSYSEVHEQPEWVAYELKKEHLQKNNYKRPFFEIDKVVKTGAAHWRNYKKSGYDKGHLCPAADRRYTQTAYNETFLTSNISPQDHSFNSGIWNSLEQKVRYWAHVYNGVFVVTGGVLNGDMKTIGEEQVSVPNAFYKVLLDYNGGKPKMIAFLLPHENTNKPFLDFVVSVDSVEELTGIDFFPKLDDTVEDKLEATGGHEGWMH